MTDIRTLPIAADIAMHKLYIAIARMLLGFASHIHPQEASCRTKADGRKECFISSLYLAVPPAGSGVSTAKLSETVISTIGSVAPRPHRLAGSNFRRSGCGLVR